MLFLDENIRGRISRFSVNNCLNGSVPEQSYNMYLLFFTEERKSFGFETARGWVNVDRIFIIGWTVPLMLRIHYTVTLQWKDMHNRISVEYVLVLAWFYKAVCVTPLSQWWAEASPHLPCVPLHVHLLTSVALSAWALLRSPANYAFGLCVCLIIACSEGIQRQFMRDWNWFLRH